MSLLEVLATLGALVLAISKAISEFSKAEMEKVFENADIVFKRLVDSLSSFARELRPKRYSKRRIILEEVSYRFFNIALGVSGAIWCLGFGICELGLSIIMLVTQPELTPLQWLAVGALRGIQFGLLILLFAWFHARARDHWYELRTRIWERQLPPAS